ncbi:MAG: hypothetical protein QOJ60_2705 [Actinomycetota bacterium]|jgi:hypothetical protein|nr:hypothetical protein [Actinomycetota bacterium]
MDRRFALIALWVVFASAAIGVGFGAAGFVGDPFNTVPSAGAPPLDGLVPALSPTPTPSATGHHRRHHDDGPTTSPTATSHSPNAGPVTSSRSTRGGYVSATCRGGLVSVSASPAVGWEIHDLTSGQVTEARVRFEPSQDANGERVEVSVRCVSGRPDFLVSDESGGGDGGGGSGSGSGGGGDG